MTVLSLLIDFENIMFILNSFSTSEQQQLSYCSTRTVAVFAQVCKYLCVPVSHHAGCFYSAHF